MAKIALILGSLLALGSFIVIMIGFFASGTYFGSVGSGFFLLFILAFIAGAALFVKGYLGIAKNKQPKI